MSKFRALTVVILLAALVIASTIAPTASSAGGQVLVLKPGEVWKEAQVGDIIVGNVHVNGSPTYDSTLNRGDVTVIGIGAPVGARDVFAPWGATVYLEPQSTGHDYESLAFSEAAGGCGGPGCLTVWTHTLNIYGRLDSKPWYKINLAANKVGVGEAQSASIFPAPIFVLDGVVTWTTQVVTEVLPSDLSFSYSTETPGPQTISASLFIEVQNCTPSPRPIEDCIEEVDIRTDYLVGESLFLPLILR